MNNTNKKNICQDNNKSPRYSTGDEQFKSYKNTFTERNHEPIIQYNHDHWQTIDFLYDYYIISHLNHIHTIGCRGKEYPEYLILDNDETPREILEDMHEELGINSNNSMLFLSPGSLKKEQSGDPDSYHTLLSKPHLNGEPVHLKQNQDEWKLYQKYYEEKHNKIKTPKGKNIKLEVYPNSFRGVRSPFGKGEIPDDKNYKLLEWFDLQDIFDNNIEPYNIHRIKRLQDQFDLEIPDPENRLPDDKNIPPVTQPNYDPEISDNSLKKSLFNNLGHAENLYKNGLPGKGCRNDSQFILIIHFWNQGIPRERIFEMIWIWIREKHNGYSLTVKESPAVVRNEILRQVNYVFDHYPLLLKCPNYINNPYYGWITMDDLIDIVIRSKGYMPLTKFLYYLISHKNPRRKNSFQGVYYKTLMGWSREYLKYIKKLKSYGIIKRGKKFTRGGIYKEKFREGKSKEIKLLDWQIRDPKDAILNNGRSPDTLYDHFRLKLQPRDLRQLLESSGCDRNTALRTVQRVYSKVFLALSEGCDKSA